MGGGRGRLCLTLHCHHHHHHHHHQTDSCIKMGQATRAIVTFRQLRGTQSLKTMSIRRLQLLKRDGPGAEAESNRDPSAYQPYNALPLGQTGSHDGPATTGLLTSVSSTVMRPPGRLGGEFPPCSLTLPGA